VEVEEEEPKVTKPVLKTPRNRRIIKKDKPTAGEIQSSSSKPWCSQDSTVESN
jgi:hypothetical protein